jgi:hypothetical protein
VQENPTFVDTAIVALDWVEHGPPTGQFAHVREWPGYRLTHVGHMMVDVRA